MAVKRNGLKIKALLDNLDKLTTENNKLIKEIGFLKGNDKDQSKLLHENRSITPPAEEKKVSTKFHSNVQREGALDVVFFKKNHTQEKTLSPDNNSQSLVMKFINKCNELNKEALENFSESKQAQERINVLQQAISILSSSQDPTIKLHIFYNKIDENRNIFQQRFNFASVVTNSFIFYPYINSSESGEKAQNLAKTYKKFFPLQFTKAEEFLKAVDEAKAAGTTDVVFLCMN